MNKITELENWLREDEDDRKVVVTFDDGDFMIEVMTRSSWIRKWQCWGCGKGETIEKAIKDFIDNEM